MGKSKDAQNLNAPGPGQYNQDDSIVKKSSARVGIPGAKRAENLPGVGTGDDPGPGHFTSADDGGWNHGVSFSREDRFKPAKAGEDEEDTGPGPGTYDA